MTASTRQTAYWFLVALYTLALIGILLYLRFPTEKFRLFAENFIEDRLPGINCSIGAIDFALPPALLFTDVRLVKAEGNGSPLFADPRLTVAPVWSSPMDTVAVTSGAYGGSHRLTVNFSGDDQRLKLGGIEIEALNLAEIEPLGRKLDRRITGLLDLQGTATVDREGLELLGLEAELAVSDGEMALKRPILELDTLVLQPASAVIRLDEQLVTIGEGKVENRSLSAVFSGRISLAEPLLAGAVDLEGSMTPRPALFQQNRQLKVIVTRMQKRYGSEALPFEVGGTVGRPTFVFER